MTMEQIIIAECTRHGGPTERCQQIYHLPQTSQGGISRRRYWAAVQEGVNRHRWTTITKRHEHEKSTPDRDRLEKLQVDGPPA